jgi:hypothetical protein
VQRGWAPWFQLWRARREARDFAASRDTSRVLAAALRAWRAALSRARRERELRHAALTRAADDMWRTSAARRAFAALRARARERAESTAIAVRAGDALLRRRYFAAWTEAVGAQRVAKEVRLRGAFFVSPLDISVY